MIIIPHKGLEEDKGLEVSLRGSEPTRGICRRAYMCCCGHNAFMVILCLCALRESEQATHYVWPVCRCSVYSGWMCVSPLTARPFG